MVTDWSWLRRWAERKRVVVRTGYPGCVELHVSRGELKAVHLLPIEQLEAARYPEQLCDNVLWYLEQKLDETELVNEAARAVKH